MSRKNDNIKLHPIYGLNPTMAQCYYCGGLRGDIILLGASIKEEAPRSMVVDLEPCDTCKKKFKDGVICHEVDDVTEKMTGRWVLLNKKAVSSAISDDTKMCYMHSSEFTEMLKSYDTENSNSEESLNKRKSKSTVEESINNETVEDDVET